MADEGLKVQLIARSGRYFCLENTKHRLEKFVYGLCGKETLIRATTQHCPADREFHKSVNENTWFTNFLLFKNLS